MIYLQFLGKNVNCYDFVIIVLHSGYPSQSSKKNPNFFCVFTFDSNICIRDYCSSIVGFEQMILFLSEDVLTWLVTFLAPT